MVMIVIKFGNITEEPYKECSNTVSAVVHFFVFGFMFYFCCTFLNS